MKTILIINIICVTLIGSAAYGQVPRNIKEASDNTKAIAVCQEQLQLDMSQLAAFKLKVENVETAYVQKDIVNVNVLKKDLETDMQREIAQSERKIA